jgi:rfaE bifunctional protein nucleotidyltransferase chain/domain
MKIITPNKLNRKAGKTYVFTNGCFDILHAGHIRLLKKSKSFGDFLIVGLNSDRSVKQIKGPKRPIVPQDQRAEVLSAIESVDYIIVYDKPTPLELILRVKPDVLVKGEDWKDKVVIGGKEMQEWGGRVELIKFTSPTSTSNIIETIIWRDR